MGSIGDVLAPVAHDLGQSAGKAVGESFAGPAVKDFAEKFPQVFNSMGKEFQKTEFGKNLWETVLNWRQTTAKVATQIGDAQSVPGFIGPKMPSYVVNNRARNIASDIHFGPNNEIIAASLHGAKMEMEAKGLASESHVQNMADNLAMITRDNRDIIDFRNGGSRTISKVKQDVASNKQFKKDFQSLKTDPVYKEPGAFERGTRSLFYNAMVPFAAINHLGDLAHAGFSIPFGPLTEAIKATTTDYKGSVESLHRFGIYEESVLNTVKQQVDYKNNIISHYLPGSVADVINKYGHMPGMNALRNIQKTLYGVAGIHTAQEMAELIVKDPSNARAIFELRDMHLDPDAVREQGGKLTDDDLSRAVYHFVNNHVFLHPEIERSFYANKNVWTRSATMFHSFVAAEGRFLTHQIAKARALKGSDPITAMRIMASIAVTYPAVGFAIHQLRNMAYLRENSHEFHREIDTLKGDYGQKAALEEYLDQYTYVGAFGIASSHARAMSRNRLLDQLAGPIVSTGAQGTTDMYHFLTTGNIKPVARDAVSMIPSAGLNKMLAYKMFPTKKMQQANKMHSLRMKGIKGLSINN